MSLPVETDRGPGVTRDVSVSGLFLITKRRPKIGDRLQLTMTFPDHESADPMRLCLRGRVVRVEDAQEAVGVGIAIDEGSGHVAQAP